MQNANSLLVENVQICSAIKPIDFNAAAQAGDWVSMKNYNRMACVFHGRVGSAGTDLTLTLEQATSVAGAGAKALNFTRIDSKEGADLLAIGQFTTTIQAAGNTYTTTNNEQLDQIIVIDILGTDLDKDNDYDCVRLSTNAGNAAKVVSALYLLWGAKYGTDPLPSAIVD
jgi:hypothetical protein